MTLLLALALAGPLAVSPSSKPSGAPGCPAALADAQALPPDLLAARAPGIVERLDAAGAGPVGAVMAAARAAERGRRALEDPAPAAASFRAALARHCALAAAPRAPDPSPADRERLAAILVRPEHAHRTGDPSALRRALAALWARLLEALGSAEAERYASLGRALFLAVAVGAAVLAGAALRRRLAGTEPSAGRAAADGRTAAEPPDASAARAEEALRRGDGREAVRWAFLAALGALERAGRVPRGRAMTNAEIVAAAASTPWPPAPHPTSPRFAGGGVWTGIPTATSTSTPTATLLSDLSALARTFDRAVYGDLAVSADEAARAVASAARVRAAAGGRA